MHDDLRTPASWEPERLPASGVETWPSRMLLGVTALLAAALILLIVGFARAKDHGFDKNDPTVQWFESLKRPDLPKYSCCGKADAYPVRIEQEPIGEEPDQMGLAIVTDGSAIAFPDGTKRPEIPTGFEFKFPLSKLNQLMDGNPTHTAWAFLAVYNGKLSVLYCVIPLPPGS